MARKNKVVAPIIVSQKNDNEEMNYLKTRCALITKENERIIGERNKLLIENEQLKKEISYGQQQTKGKTKRSKSN